MVGRSLKTRSRSKSPCLTVMAEIDNTFLSIKNVKLTQTVVKLKKENADLTKQLSLFQGEVFDLSARCNNFKNIISTIDSNAKVCLPKLNEVVTTFTGIIQLCSVAARFSDFTTVTPTAKASVDLRTQAVKPQIVNGHVLHNPTITLSRLSSDNLSRTPPCPDRAPDIAMPSTSRTPSQSNGNRRRFIVRGVDVGSDDSDDSDEDSPSSNENRNSSFIQTNGNMDTSAMQEDYDNSDAENEAPAEEEESEASENDRRLRTLLEVTEEDAEEESHNSTLSRSRHRRLNVTQEEESSEEFLNNITLRPGQLRRKRTKGEEPEGESSDSPVLRSRPRRLRRMEEDESEEELQESLSPRSHQRKLLQGGLPEIMINLDQLPNTYIEQFRGNVNTSGSTLNNSNTDDSEEVSWCPQDETSLGKSSSCRQNGTGLELTANSKSTLTLRSITLGETSKASSSLSKQFPGNISAIRSAEARSVQPETSQETMNTELEHTTSTPIVPRISNGASASRSRTYDSPNRRRNDSPSFKSNITKRKAAAGKGKTKREISPQKSPIRRPRRAAQPKLLKEPSLTKKMRR